MLAKNKFTQLFLLAQKTAPRDRRNVRYSAINEQDSMPSSAAFRNRFGSLIRAYQLIGYTPRTDYSFVEINRYLRGRHPVVP